MATDRVRTDKGIRKMLNKSKGNMYPWVTHTWNVVKGKCPHDCLYCYMKDFPQKDMRFDMAELNTRLGHHNFIFVGSSCDMWAQGVPDEWIAKILKYCRDNDVYNKWLFQSKNPARFWDWMVEFPDTTTLGITLESNRCWTGSKAPCTSERYMAFKDNPKDKMVSIEPVMDFDLDNFVFMIEGIKPIFVSIGADSKRHNLPEPSGRKVAALIQKLQQITEVKVKENLTRILQHL